MPTYRYPRISRLRLIYANAGIRTSGMRWITVSRRWRWIFEPRYVSIARASFRVRRLYRFRGRRAASGAIPPETFPIRRRPVHFGRALRRERRDANEWWRRGVRARRLCEE